MTDGTRYEPEWRVRSEEDSWIDGIHQVFETEAGEVFTAITLFAVDDGMLASASCLGGEDYRAPDRADGLAATVDPPSLPGSHPAPFFFAAPPVSGWSRLYADGVETEWNTRDGESYGWLCVEHA